MGNMFKRGFEKRDTEAKPVISATEPQAEKPAEPKPEKPAAAKEKQAKPAQPKQAAKRQAAPKAQTKAKPAKEEPEILFPEKAETKTQRVNLLLKPSDHKRWTAEAKKRGVSLTVLIETVMNAYVGKE